jgi:DNA-binding winged helix-turn-helix (wHTH) protein/tetratricopeptide (TPR) repeat protein
MSQVGGRRVRFGSFTLDRDEGILRHGSETVSLRPKTWALLCYLVERPGRLATKQAVLDALWPDVAVNDAAVANCISELRAALGDDRRRPRYIEVAHRRGYRWIAPVQEESSEQPATPSTAARPRTHFALGREAELQQLNAAFAHARSRERQIVFVTGEAGIGKTTLVDEFTKVLGVRGLGVGDAPPRTLATCLIGRGQCIEQHGPTEPYLPVLDAFSDLCRAGGVRVVDVLRRHAPLWLAQLPSFLTSEERLSLRAEIQGASRERMLREMGDAVDALAAEAPLILVLEDVHWSDDATVDLIAYLARRRAPAQLLLIATYRPVTVAISEHPLKHVKQDLRVHRLCEEIALSFLTEALVAAFLAMRFPQHAFPDDLAAMIHQQTDGNPLFIVAVLDFLLARGWIVHTAERWELTVPVAEVRAVVPDSLKQMIERQIEEQAAHSLPLLEAASQLGAEFSTQSLAAAADISPVATEAQCDALVGKQQVLHACGVSEWPDGTVGARYAFSHVLYQKVLANRVSPARQRRLHQRIGERIEVGWGDRTADVCAELAAHFERSGDHARTVRYLRESAARALQRGGVADAKRSIEKALVLIEAGSQTPERVMDTLLLTIALAGTIQTTEGYSDPEVETLLQRALAMSEQLDVAPQRFAALAGLWAWAYFRGKSQECATLAGEMLDIAAHVGAPGMQQAAGFLAGSGRLIEGRLEDARALLEESLHGEPWPSPFARPDFHVGALVALGRVYTLLGLPERGAAACRRGLERARQVGPFDTAYASCQEANRTALARDIEATRQAGDAAIELVEQFGFTRLIHYPAALRGWAFAASGQPHGIEALRAVLVERQQHELHGESSWFHCLLTSALLDVGRPDDACDVADAGIAGAGDYGGIWVVAELHRLRGECARARNAAPEAGRSFEQAIEIAQAQKAKWWELRAAASLARLHAGTRHARAATERLRAVHEWFSEGFDTVDLREVRALLR